VSVQPEEPNDRLATKQDLLDAEERLIEKLKAVLKGEDAIARVSARPFCPVGTISRVCSGPGWMRQNAKAPET
jgi:hypothetical protein